MKRYLRKLANSFVGIGTRRTINITDGGKYGTVSARVFIRYDSNGKLEVYVEEAGSDWRKRQHGLDWQRVYSSYLMEVVK